MAETENVLIQTHTYDAVGHCIYCGTKDGKLTTEHVIPYGLIGRLKLPAASCTPCQKIIHPMETWCQTKFLGHVRYRLNVPPRKNRPRPASHPMTIKTEDGRELSISVPIADLPRVLSLPMLPPPGLLLGPAEAASNQFRWWSNVNWEDMQKFALTHGKEGNALLQSFRMEAFVRVIAKIAHGAAWSGISQELRASFTMLLPDLILGKQASWFPFIGGDDIEGHPPEEYLNVIEAMGVPMGKKEYLVMRVRLFAPLGAPNFYAVAGVRDTSER